MSLFDNDITLPGVVTEIVNDYSSGYDTSLFGTTDSVLVIGTAFNGPVGKVVEVYSPEHSQYVFGQIYNSTTRQEATLVSNILDAWDRGCRTIYACRVSGKDINKDYELAIDTDFKLRLSGIFPSNSNKDLTMVFNKDTDEMNIKIYKPSERATINEKKQGIVESSDSIIVNTIDLYGNGITLESELTELVKIVNEYLYNNVLRLSIVDENGNDVTLSSIDAKSLKVGDMFPGLYTVGRDATATSIAVDTKVDIVLDKAPYEGFEGKFYKHLSLNTNVSKDIPLYSEEKNLNVLIGETSIGQFDFLEAPGTIDKYFLKNKIDYEEVNINDFDLYKRLGKGYAINAYVVEDGSGRAKVKEVVDKATKKTEIVDGLYSSLENVVAQYRVLTKVTADQKIKGTLPKPKDFQIAKAKSLKLLNDSITITPKVKSNDLTAIKKYAITFSEMEPEETLKYEDVRKTLYTEKTVREATELSAADLDKKTVYEEGSLFLVKDVKITDFAEVANVLYVYTNGKMTLLNKSVSKEADDLLKDSLVLVGDKIYICNSKQTGTVETKLSFTSFKELKSTDLVGKEYVIVSTSNGTFVIAEFLADTATILGTVDQVLTEEEDKLFVSLSNNYATNKINIKSNQFDFLTIDEVVDILNEDKDFKKLFTVAIVDSLKAQELITDLDGGTLTGTIDNKEIIYDKTLLIPFRTDDNFARHLAQHCMYTSLKTSPTHGVIGTKVLLDTSIDSITNKVSELADLKLESSLVAKKGNGANMLDKNNMPYMIGRKISVTAVQYPITTSTNYTFVSNGAAGYAGMVSGLGLDQSSTCQKIIVPDLTYELTNYQLSVLNKAGFVTIRKSYTKGWVVTDGITMAPSDSIYKRLSASRIGDAVESLIREATEPFIGKQNHLSNQNSLRSAIKSKLDTIKNVLIEAYDFKLILDPQQTKLGIINIDYAIVPIYEIKEIINNITMSE